MILRYFEEALNELLHGLDYYSEEHPVLGRAFYAEIQNSEKLIKRFPDAGKKHKKYPHLRILPYRRFPYSLIYHISGETIYVVAVAHQNRKPDYWTKRL